MNWRGKLIKLDEYRYKISREYKEGMLTDGIIYSSNELLAKIKDDQAPEQVANVAMLPGIIGNSLAMPDIHWGYGFPIGGVAAFDCQNGIISPGGVGYDINCGVRLLRTDLMYEDIRSHIDKLIHTMFTNVPSGLGSTGKIRIDQKEVQQVLTKGAKWAIQHNFGWNRDIDHIEENGAMTEADPSGISKRALERGRAQLGTLGAGNHFLEIQVVENIYDEEASRVLGIDRTGQIVVMIHTGSRGLGYQICDDSIRMLRSVTRKYGIIVPDQQLVCAPINSAEGQMYFSQMACAANYAWANRQCIMHWVRESFEKVLGQSAEKIGMHLVYDVAHNIAKLEEHDISGKKMKLCIHRKGATRSFPSGYHDIPADYSTVGQPVLIPGDMGSHSYLLLGTERALTETFGSTCHGAGRQISRTKALEQTKGRYIDRELAAKGIIVLSASSEVLREEVPEAYKDVDHVVDAVARAGISRKIARMRPVGVVKG